MSGTEMIMAYKTHEEKTWTNIKYTISMVYVLLPNKRMPNICKHILQESIDWVSLFQTGFKYFIVIFESKLYSNFNSIFRWLNRN